MSIYAWADVIGVSVCIVAIVCGVAALLIDRHRDPIGLHAGTDDVEEHLEPLRSGSAKVGRRISAEFRSKGLMLPNRASAAARQLATALDKSRRASRLRAVREMAGRLFRISLWRFTEQAERRLAKREESKPAPRGRHAAPKGAGSAPLLAAPLAAPPEVAHDPAAGMHTGNTEAIADARNGGHPVYADHLYADPDTARYGWNNEDGPAPYEPEDPYELLIDPVDLLVGDLVLAELAEPEPERAPRRQPGRCPPIAVLRVGLLVADALAVAAKAAITVYPEWETGQFAIVDAGIGAAAEVAR